MSSRFWAAEESSDSDGSGSGSDSDSSSSSGPKQKVPSKFAAGGDSSSDDDDRKRVVVKSARDKRYDEMHSTIKATRNHMKINDWGMILADFEKLQKQVQKAQAIINKEGIPRFFIKILCSLEDHMNATAANKEEVKKMKSTNAKALNAMKQRLRKHNKQYEADMAKYRASPDADSDASAAEASESSDSEEEVVAKKPAAAAVPSKFAKKPAKEADDDDDDDDWSEDEDEESSSSESDDNKKATGKAKWIKKETSSSAKPAVKAPEKPRVQKVRKGSDDDEPARQKQVATADSVELTEEAVDSKLKEIIAGRGRRGTDRKEQIQQLQQLTAFTKNPIKLAQVLVHLTSAQFDINPSLHTHMPVDMWRSCFSNITKLLQVVTSNPEVILEEEAAALPVEDEEDAEEVAPRVVGNLLGFLERLDDELYKSLQFIESHTADYARRLQDTVQMVALIDGVHKYYVSVGNLKVAARCCARKLEHLYYKHDDLVNASEGQASGAKASQSAMSNAVEQLCSEIYRYGDDRTKTRGMVCHIYYNALHDRFYVARDLMLMSHLQETVHQADVGTMILFNRAMAQLGLCAFRAGLIAEAHACFSEICGLGRTKELLAQGLSQARYDRNPEQERQERRRMVPYHMHINLDLLECCHLVSAMLMEVPHMAANAYDSKRKVISKPLRRLFEHYERQVLVGPPESMRDFVMAAARALRDGDWKKSAGYILGLDVWNHISRKEEVKTMLKAKIQQEGLRTYLFTYCSHYDAMSLDQLVQIFELPKQLVHSIVSKLMISGELHASWDQPTNSIVMHHIEPTRLQFLALQFADKAAVFVENNERLLDSRSGGGYRDQKGQHKEHTRYPEGGNPQWHNNYGGNAQGARYGRARQRHNAQHMTVR